MIKHDRRQQLLEATIDVLARKSFSSLTTTDVAKQAGISSATVFVYFTSKEELFRETLLWLETCYRERGIAEGLHMESAPHEYILALLRTDLADEMTELRILRAWTAFRSEMRSLYEELVEEQARREHENLKANFLRLDPVHGSAKADILRATIDGLLRSMNQKSMTVTEARIIARNCLIHLLPSHFPKLVTDNDN